MSTAGPRRVRRAPALLALAAATVALLGCGSPPADREPGPRTLVGRAPEITAQVEVTAAGFSVEDLRLGAGEALELANADERPLRIVGHLDDARRYDTGDMEPGESTVIAFADGGAYRFTVDDHENAGPLVITVPVPTPEN